MSSNSQLYSSFHHIMLPEDPTSSEDGSGLHSPVFAGSQSTYPSHHPGGPGGAGHDDANFRYAGDHLDVHGYDAASHHHQHPHHPQQQPQHQQHHNPYPQPQHHAQHPHHQQAHHHPQQSHHHQQQHLNAPQPPPPPSDRHHLGSGGGSAGTYPGPQPQPQHPSSSVYHQGHPQQQHHEQQRHPEQWYGGPPGPSQQRHQHPSQHRNSHSSSSGGEPIGAPAPLTLDHKLPHPQPPPFGMMDPHGGLHGGPGMSVGAGGGLVGPGGHPVHHHPVGVGLPPSGGGGHVGGGHQGGSESPREEKKPSNTVIACRNCRSRKIRCDSTRPQCNNCVRRNNQCEYDLVPKRRGPDKRPGTRQRSCKKRPAPDDGGDGESASPVQSSHPHTVPPPPPRESKKRRTATNNSQQNHPNSHSATNTATSATGGSSSSNLGLGLGTAQQHHPPGGGIMSGLGGNVSSLGGLSSPNPAAANGFVAGTTTGPGLSDPNVGMQVTVGSGGGVGISGGSGGIVGSVGGGSVSNGILPVSNGMGGVVVTGHHGHGQHHHHQHGHGGQLNGGAGGMAINSNVNGVGGGGLSGGPTSTRIKAEHGDGGNVVLQRSPTSATSSGSYHTQQDLRPFQPPHHLPHQHPQQQHEPPEIRLTNSSVYTMSFHPSYEQRSLASGYEQKPPHLEMNHRSHWDRLVQNPGITVILREIEFLMDGTAHMLSFIPLAHFSKRLWSDAHRQSVHPAFIYALLGLARLMRSSKQDPNRDENLRAAMDYRADARRLIDESHNHWVDIGLAEAALVLAIFESSAHPQYTPANYLSSLTLLDDLIRSLALTSSDQALNNVSRFSEGGVPIVFTPTVGRDLAERRACDCLRSPAVLGTSPRPPPSRPDYPTGPNGIPIKRFIPPWPQEWTSEQIRAEEIRRVCWSALDLISAYLAQCAVDSRAGGRFWVADASKWALFFPGEAYEAATSPSVHQHHPNSPQSPSYQAPSPNSNLSASPVPLIPKESVWSLYCRSMLLWCYTVGLREGPQPSGPQLEDQRAEDAADAWQEVHAIEDSLDAHKCNLDTGLMIATREYLHNVRMTVTQVFRRLNGYDRNSPKSPGPVLNRQHAEDWYYHQDLVARSISPATNSLQSPMAVQLTQRPFRVQWFIRQLAIALQLWRIDQNYRDVLQLGKRLLQIVEVMNYLWECPHNWGETRELRQQLSKACHEAGLAAPHQGTPSMPYGTISLHETGKL